MSRVFQFDSSPNRSNQPMPGEQWCLDLRTWHMALWRAAVLRNALNAANTSHANCPMPDHEQIQMEINMGQAQQTVVLLMTPENDQIGSSTLQEDHQNAFMCTIPTRLTGGQRIRIGVGNVVYEADVTPTRAVVCRTDPIPTVLDGTPSIFRSFIQCDNETGPTLATSSLCTDTVLRRESNPEIITRHNQPEPILNMITQHESGIPQLHDSTCPLTSAQQSIGVWPSEMLNMNGMIKGPVQTCLTRKRSHSQGNASISRRRKRELNVDETVARMEIGSKIMKSENGVDPEPTLDSVSTVDGVNLEEIRRFAKLFKMKRLSLGLTQTQVGQTLSLTNGPAYSQSAICRFEKLDITPKSAQKIKPVLERWLQEVEDQIRIIGGVTNASHSFSSISLDESKSKNRENSASVPVECGIDQCRTEIAISIEEEEKQQATVIRTNTVSTSPPNGTIGNGTNCKRRKRRTSFTPQALELLNEYFERNRHPSGVEMTWLAERLNYEREVIRVWFCNKRQALKNSSRKAKTSN